MPDGDLKDSLQTSVDIESGIITIEPNVPLKKEDFKTLSDLIDGYLLKNHRLHGLLIIADNFPGWDSFAAFTKHMTFVRNHHRRIEKIAIVTESVIGRLAESLADHFVEAEIRHFRSGLIKEATTWLRIPTVEPKGEENKEDKSYHSQS